MWLAFLLKLASLETGTQTPVRRKKAASEDVGYKNHKKSECLKIWLRAAKTEMSLRR